MSGTPRLPTFLVIGAMKSGTTSLFQYLSMHPHIAMGTEKEIDFFSRGDQWCRGVAWYSEFFAANGPAGAVGECSTSYSMFPLYPEAPARIAAVLPDVRLLYVVRDPIDRIRSHYEHAVLSGIETRSIEDAVTTDPQYVAVSSYACQLRRYLDCFDSGRILVVSSSDLEHRRAATLSTVFAFVGVDRTWWTTEYEHEHYVTEARPELRAGARRLTSVAPVKYASRVLPARSRARLAGSRLLSHPRGMAARPTISGTLRAELVARLSDDVADFRELAKTVFDTPSIGLEWTI